MRVIIFVLAIVALAQGRVLCPCAGLETDSQELPQVEEPEQTFPEIEGPSVDPLPGPEFPEIEGPSVDPLPSRTESHFFPNANNPVVAVHVTVDREINTDLPAVDPMPELPPMWSKEEEEIATNFPAPEVMPPLFPGSKPWIRSARSSFENLPFWGAPETRPEPEQPIARPDPSTPLIPHEDKTIVRYYPSIEDPIVSLHIIVEKATEELPMPELPMPIFPFPEALTRFLSPETKPLPENEGPSVDPLPGIPPREPPSILEPETESSAEEPIPIVPKIPIVEIVIRIKKPVLEDMPGSNLPAPELPTPIFPEPEFLRPETRPLLVPEVRPFPLAPELRPLPENLVPETKPEILAPETKPSLVPEVKPWPIPEGEEPQDIWPEYIEPTPLVDIAIHVHPKQQNDVPLMPTPY